MKLWQIASSLALVGAMLGCLPARGEATSACLLDPGAVANLRRAAASFLLTQPPPYPEINRAAGVSPDQAALDAAIALVDQPSVCEHVIRTYAGAPRVSEGPVRATVIRVGRAYFARTNVHGYSVVFDRRMRQVGLPFVDLD
jgi:hypothetical protein